PAEHVAGADVAALAAEQVLLKPLQGEQVDQFGDDGTEGGGHGLTIGQEWTADYTGGAGVAPRPRPPACSAQALQGDVGQYPGPGKARARVELAPDLHRRVVAGRHDVEDKVIYTGDSALCRTA